VEHQTHRVRSAGAFAQMQETFAQYWADAYHFEEFDHQNERHRSRLRRALAFGDRGFAAHAATADIEPKDYQKPVLDELTRTRELGRHRNLLVAATGTGKTVMAALDHRALREAGRVDTLLYIAHRREILDQARSMFRNALQQPGFGELLYQGERPEIGRHVFASIDSLGPSAAIDPAAFDHVVLDEAHHSPAVTWE
jgi:superfamily II DNA or RNA helicase